jgi:hypothetical protein
LGKQSYNTPYEMKHFFLSIVIGVFLFLHGNVMNGQTTAAAAMQHPVILKYYTPAQLTYMEQNDTAELASIIYYFTKSFIVVPIECTDCIPFDSTNFDVTKYEHLRLRDDTYIRTFDKYGFKLILVPINQLPYQYAIHSVSPVGPGAPANPAENNQPH